jgi:large subunit ribosomal protein L29
MKKKKIDIHQVTDQELDTDLHESVQKLFRLRYSHAAVPLKNPLEIRHLRRHVARLKTVIQERAKKP